MNRAPESGSSSAAATGSSSPDASAGRSMPLTRAVRMVCAPPARSTTTYGLVTSTPSVSLTPAQLLASVSSISDAALRLPGLAVTTLAPDDDEATFFLTVSFLVTVWPADTVSLLRVWPLPAPTNNTS